MNSTDNSYEKEECRCISERKKIGEWRCREQRRHLKHQLALTDSLLGIVEKAVGDEREIYRYIVSTKSSGAAGTVCTELDAVNEERLLKLVKVLSELIGIQHDILAVPLFKETADAENSRAKLESDRDIALRKIELELMKVDGSESNAIPEQLLDALSGDDDDP